MNLLYAQYTPFFLASIAVGLGVIYSNSRITDIKDLIKAEANAVRAEVRSEIARLETAIRGDLARLETRMDRLEARGGERIVRS